MFIYKKFIRAFNSNDFKYAAYLLKNSVVLRLYIYLIHPNLLARFFSCLLHDSKGYFFYNKKILHKLIYRKRNSKIYFNDLFHICLMSGNQLDLAKLFSKNTITLSKINQFLYFLSINDLIKAYDIYQILYYSVIPYKVIIYEGNQNFLNSIRKRKLIVLSDKFIGDEIRYSRLYCLIFNMLKKQGAYEIVFTCNNRIYNSLKKNYNYNFICIDSNSIDNINNNNKSVIEQFLSKNKAEYIIPIFSCLRALLDFYLVKDKESLTYLSNKESFFQPIMSYNYKVENVGLLKNKYKIIGLCWRSMFNNWQRTLNSFNVSDFEFLFKLENIKIVICQYDVLTEDELNFLNRFKDNVILIEELNQKDDIDGTFYLYSKLDYMISCPSYPSDVSGVLGIKTLICSKVYISSYFSDNKGNHAFFGEHVKAKKVDNCQNLKDIVISFINQ